MHSMYRSRMHVTECMSTMQMGHDICVTLRKQQRPGIATDDTMHDTAKSSNKATMNCRYQPAPA